MLLKSGALIAPVQIVEERTIGPSLGAQNVEPVSYTHLLSF